MPNLAPAILALTLTACGASLTPAAQAIRDVPPEAVTRCTFIATIRGTSSIGAAMGSLGENAARNDALNEAAEKGATDMVWMGEGSGLGGAGATGRAYRCSKR